MTISGKIRRLIKQGKTPSQVAKALNIRPARVYTVMWLDKKKQEQKPPKILDAVQEMKSTLDALDKIKDVDPVNHPPHYKTGGIETIDFIEAKDLNYRLGNVVKYVSRAGRKHSDPVQDLEKAAWYLQREIDARKNA
jgi:hypothetical protein